MEKSEWSLEKWCDGFYKERIGKVYGDFEVIAGNHLYHKAGC